MNTALLTVTLSAAAAAAAVAVRATFTPRLVLVRANVPTPVRGEGSDDWHPHVSSGCGR